MVLAAEHPQAAGRPTGPAGDQYVLAARSAALMLDKMVDDLRPLWPPIRLAGFYDYPAKAARSGCGRA